MLSLLVSDKKGRIFNVPEFETAGMKAGCFFKLGREEFIKMPEGSKIFMLPGRVPVGHNVSKGKFEALEDYFAVAVFMAPAFTGAYSSAYIHTLSPNGGEGRVRGRSDVLPLFCYTAAGFYKGDIYVAAIRVDKSSRHDPAFINVNSVAKNVEKIKKLFSGNRLIRHLADCALVNGCPGAQNYFLSREECPLPTSPVCNADCAGCISIQTQPRIKFVPSPEEIRDVALFHIERVKNPVLSFGQGCEGEPLLQADVIEKSIRLIRKHTDKGAININTNASRPEAISCLFDAGLNSIRVSMNSVRQEYYVRYYKPKGYRFEDVLKSIKIAKNKGGFVSINYLTMPGFTDSKDEYAALKKFIEVYKIDMIQWRNLNFDPLAYFKIIKCSVLPSGMIGVRQLIQSLKKSFPRLKMGYYNPYI
jgi:pyruvate-formate lyase-activating enzyme